MSAAPQFELFDAREASRTLASYPAGPGYKVRGPSAEAARQIAGKIKRLQADVLAELRRWPAGRTADQIADGLQRSPLSIRPRVTELKALGKIVPTGERRRNESGMSASVWKVSADV